jgi:hypothetical protein
MTTYHEFDTLAEARTYRHEHGTGGWIFAPEDRDQKAILFPPHMTPVEIFNHRLTSGQSGRLIGSQ